MLVEELMDLRRNAMQGLADESGVMSCRDVVNIPWVAEL